jgi:serine/threonine protein phosphatase 1
MMSHLFRAFRRRPAVPAPTVTSVPPGLRIYAVGDIHGRSDLLDELLETLRTDACAAADRGEQPIVVFLGDYIDRGPDSRGVLDRLSALTNGPIQWRFLEGNHEMAMRAFLADPLGNQAWLRFGGQPTLASFGIACPEQPDREWLLRAAAELAERLPSSHHHFLDQLDLLLQWGDYAFVHAGIRPGVPLEAQSRSDLLSIREPFLSARNWHGKRIVHGHTVVAKPIVTPTRIALDTGAYNTGRLTCLVLKDSECAFFATCEDGYGVRWLEPSTSV